MNKNGWESATYWLKKLLQFAVVMLVLSVIVFYMARLAPGDPLKSFYGDSVERMSELQKQAALEKLGLNQPIYKQYGAWLQNALQGEFGISFKYKQPVSTVIAGVYQNTLLLGGTAYLLTFALALLLGIVCCLREDTILDKAICKIGTVTNCIPSFWIALVLILIFSINLAILPSGGAYAMGQADNWASRVTHMILPLSVLLLSHLWYYAYMIRNKLLYEIRQEYVLLCKVKGLSNLQILFRHCLPNIMPSFISLMAISIPHILGGTYVVEKVFSYPGLGTLSFESAKFHDYNMLMVLCLLTGAVVVLANMLAEVLNDKIDPRMKRGGGDEDWTFSVTISK